MHTPPRKHHNGRGFGRRGSSGVVYYGIPYYIPYYVYSTEAAPASGPEPFSSYPSGASPTANATNMPTTAKPLTLLAFKDHTVVIVVDYWLEGDWLYYEITPGQRLSAPLDRLDQPLTQQLNRERNVPFILEARP